MVDSPQPQPPASPDLPPPQAGDDTSEQLAEVRREIRAVRRQVRQLRRELHHARKPSVEIFPQLPGTEPTHGSYPQAILSSWQRFQEKVREKRDRFVISARQEWRPGSSIWWDVSAVTVILLVAIVARYVHLYTIPIGIQDDESMAIFQAQYTWEVGWTGVWNPQSGGFPAGFIYLAAPMVQIFGANVVAIRYLSAGLDVITVLLVYITLRRAFGFSTACIGALLVAVSAFHIQFARIAFPNILWPTLVMAGVCSYVEALRRDHAGWWAASGFCFGLAIYSHSNHALYLFVLGLFFAWYFVGLWVVPALAFAGLAWFAPSPLLLLALALAIAFAATSPQLRCVRTWIRALSFGGAFAVAMYPMVAFMVRHPDQYFDHGKNLSIFSGDVWQALPDRQAQADFLWDRYKLFWDGLTMNPWQNGVDGSGAAPYVPLLMMLVALVGIGFGLVRRRHPLVALGVLTLALDPIASIWTADFAIRRAMIIAPFICMFAAIAVVECVRLGMGRSRLVKIASVVLAVALVGQMSWRNLDNFFNKTNPSGIMSLAQSEEWVKALHLIEGLPDGYYVYSWSIRWPWGHITQRLLAPDVPGTSRGDPFEDNSLAVDYSLGRPIILMYYGYQDHLPQYQSLYPGGEVIVGPKHWDDTQETSYTIYILPERPP